jgi:transcriptional regulator with XRE-family HTH domain
MDLNAITASRIKNKREEINLKQAEFAKVIKMSPSAYSRLENGEIQITLNTLVIIAEALKTSIVELIQVKDSEIYNNHNNTIVQQGHVSVLNIHLTPEQFSNLEGIFKKAKQD